MMKKKVEKTTSLPTRWIASDVTSSVLSACRSSLSFSDDIQVLVNGTIDPETFHDAESFRSAYRHVEMWSKYPFQIPGVDRSVVGREAFDSAEGSCGQSNARLVDLFSRCDVPEGIRSVLWKARRRLERLFDGFTVEEIARHARWGPGSSTSLPARFSTPQNKWVLSSHITIEAVPYLDAYVGWSGWLLATQPVLVEGNMVTFVPKNAKTDRSIAIEPDWNMFFQLGLGGAIRKRLQKWGVLLPIAQDINKVLARKGSQSGFLATVDLKAASDSISLALVEALLPPTVLQHVLALRSPKGSFDGGVTWFSYEKVSSMGNGFTFELETALFWAICSEVAGHAMVYGDDIVVPSASVGFLREVLSFCGFTFNDKKSHFGDSPFRESCGGHYFLGVDVTPIYVREPLVGLTRIEFCNRLRKLASDQNDATLLVLWDVASRNVPRCFRGPETVPGCLHDEFSSVVPHWSNRLQCHTGKRLARVHDVGQALQLGAYRYWLHEKGSEPMETSYSRLPGIPREVVRDWYSDGYCLTKAGFAGVVGKPIKPTWKHDGSPVYTI